MFSEKRVLTRGLLVLSVVVGAAMAAEPIFVTPPTAVAPSPGAVNIDDLPVAKTWPADRPVEQQSTTPQALPVFVAPPPVSPKPAAATGAGGRQEQATTASRPAPVATEKEKSVEQPAPGIEPAPVAPDEAVVDVRLGLGLEPVKVDPRLPPELGLVQTALAKAVAQSERLPEAEARKALCGEAGRIVEHTSELARTPLIEVTTHFTLWREGMARLRESAATFERRCQRPSASSVRAFRQVVRDFDALLEVR